LTAAAALLLMALTGSPAVRGAAAPEDHLSRNWYYTEVVVFQRPGIQDHANEEALARPPARLPQTLWTFRTPFGQQWPLDRLDPDTRAQLTFPYLDQARLAAPEALRRDADIDPAERTGTSAGQPPPGIEPQLAPDPLLDFLRRVADFEASLEAQSYRWLEPESFTLSRLAQRLERKGGYQVLVHGRWLQPVPPREEPQPLLVQAGPRYADGFALEGTFEVTVGRYLHFRADLFYTEPLLGRTPVSRPLAPARGTAAALSVDPRALLTEDDLAPAGFMQLHESRRLRSGELHLLDHPKLGVLFRIEPVTLPESLSAAYVAVEKRDQ
jgi:hypothetical protein